MKKLTTELHELVNEVAKYDSKLAIKLHKKANEIEDKMIEKRIYISKIQDKIDELEDYAWNREEYNIILKRSQIRDLIFELCEVEDERD